MKDLQHYYDVLINELNSWLEALVAGLPSAAMALLVIILFSMLALLLAHLVKRMTLQLSDSDALVRLFGTFTRICVITIGLIIALGVLGLQKTVFSLLAGAGVVGLAIGFAFQDLAANFIAGIFMAFRKPFHSGDIIETQDFLGKVLRMNMRNTLVETFDGQVVIIPNKQVFENPLINYNLTGYRRIKLEVGVSYDSNLSKVVETAQKALESLEFVENSEDRPVQVIAESFGDSAIDFNLYYWIKYPGDINYFDAISEGTLAIRHAFDEQDINIPFPIRTLDLGIAEQQSLPLKSLSDDKTDCAEANDAATDKQPEPNDQRSE